MARRRTMPVILPWRRKPQKTLLRFHQVRASQFPEQKREAILTYFSHGRERRCQLWIFSRVFGSGGCWSIRSVILHCIEIPPANSTIENDDDDLKSLFDDDLASLFEE